MRFPQELVDIVIDEVARLGDSSSERTLRACSLTARSLLPRSQLHLFTEISFRGYSDERVLKLMKFDGLLTESPHIGELVRCLSLQLDGWKFGQVYEKTVVVPRMLRLLPRLAHLDLDLQCDDDYFWVSQPEILKTSLHAAFSRNCF
ncbi:hypothetical protein C8J57DRAFT_1497215 [Mycena rebaudengoi]|nr:hypothetical protein C8J57DRAFT_1497215 [Mycena rebaudengoi]